MTGEQFDQAIWAWLPARADRRRTTIPTVIAAALDMPVTDVTGCLRRMEAAGNVIRDRRTGRRADHWHRGRPIRQDPVDTEEWYLC